MDSPYVLKVFADQNNIRFPMLSDFNKETIQTYGAMHEDLGGLKGVAKRSVFVLDADGIVRFKWVSDDPKVEPDYDEIIEFVNNIKAAAGIRS